MANFGSKKIGFYTSVSGGSGGGQNLQQTLGFGDTTTNNINMYSDYDSNKQLFIEDDQIINKVQGTSIENKIIGNEAFLTNGSETTLFTSTSLQLIKNSNTNTLNFDTPQFSGYHTLPNYSGTLALSEMVEIDEISIDGTTYDIGSSGSIVNYNCFFIATMVNGTINFVTSGIAPNVPFYICISDGGGYTLTFEADSGSTPVRGVTSLTNKLGLVTIIYSGGSIFIQ